MLYTAYLSVRTYAIKGTHKSEAICDSIVWAVLTALAICATDVIEKKSGVKHTHNFWSAMGNTSNAFDDDIPKEEILSMLPISSVTTFPKNNNYGQWRV